MLGNVDRDAAVAKELGLRITVTVETHTHADHLTGASALRRLVGSDVLVPKKTGASKADRYLQEGDVVEVGSIKMHCMETPGHTSGCMSFHVPSVPCIFTGDTLLIRGCGRTDFQSGNAHRLFHSIHRILSLSDETLLFVGHDYRGLSVSTVREERNWNPRVGGEVSEGDFVGFMNNLNLPHPKQMAEAVPANLVCGELQTDHLPAR